MAEAESWRPLSQRNLPQSSVEEAPYEGVPDHLRAHLIGWLQLLLSFVSWEEVALRLRVPLPVGGADQKHLVKYLTSKGQEDAFLDAVDLVIALLARWMDQTSKANRAYYRNYVTKLDSLLTFAGSAWRVAPNGRGLVRRLDEAVVQATKQVTASDSASAEHLLQAWQSAYGRNPSASRAYSEAIKAVEAAAAPVVLPNDRLATLGKIIAALRQGLQRWELAIPGQTRPAADPSTLLGMLELLWHGQTDRHGGINPTRPIPPEAGPAAVHLAVTLVQWFQSGVVRRTDNTS